MSIVLVGSTSGSITLQEPAVAGTTVLNLPATSGTLVTTATQKVINVERLQNSTRASLSNTTTTPITLVTFTYNKQSASTSLIFIVNIPVNGFFSGTMAVDLTYGSSSAFGSLQVVYVGQGFIQPVMGQATLTGYTTTGSQTLTVRYYAPDGSSVRPGNVVNPNSTDEARNIQHVSTVTVIEYS